MIVKTEVLKIGPTEASGILRRLDVGQRPIYRPKVLQMADDMRNGRWKMNGETIIFDEIGRCLDGQHRLSAVVEAGVAVEFLVVKNVKSNTFHTIDTGRARTPGHALQIAGYRNANQLAAAARILRFYQRGDWALYTAWTITNEEILMTVRAHPELVTLKPPSKITRRILASAYLFLRYTTGCIDENKSDLFFDLIESGHEREQNPAVKFRNTALLLMSRKHKPSKMELLGLAIKSFNAYMAGREVRALRISRNEQFPRLIPDPFPPENQE